MKRFVPDADPVQAKFATTRQELAAALIEREPEHLEILTNVLWDDPGEQPEKAAHVIARIANPTGMRVTQMLLEAEQVLAATDVTNLAQAATAAAKLGEIDKQLGTLTGNGRVERARTYVREQVRKIKLASIEAI